MMASVDDISAGSPLARLTLQDNANNWVRYVKMYPAVGQYINIKEMFVSFVASLHQGSAKALHPSCDCVGAGLCAGVRLRQTLLRPV